MNWQQIELTICLYLIQQENQGINHFIYKIDNHETYYIPKVDQEVIIKCSERLYLYNDKYINERLYELYIDLDNKNI